MELDKILDNLKEQGYKLTEQRKEIIQSIINEDRYVSAKDILQQVQQRFPGVSFDTIYRNLAILSDLDVVEETRYDGEAKFRISCIDDHHHHLVCEECGETSVLPECPLNLLQGMVGEFKITGHRFEIYGICKKCQQNKK